MSTNERELILNTATRLFDEHCNREVLDAVANGEWPEALWRAVDEAGFMAVSAATASGELALGDVYALLTVAGRHAVPLPLAEMLLAAQVLAEKGVATEGRIVALVLAKSGDSLQWDGNKLSGTISQVGFGRHLQGMVVALDGSPMLLWIPKLDARVTPQMNAAGEPCDRLDFKDTPAKALSSKTRILEMLALSRALQMAGAMEAALELTVGYALERNQFGRPIAGFQAIQQQLAFAAGEVAAATCAAESGLEGLGTLLMSTAAAIAKARVGEAVAPVSAIAHQVHGAMGFTYEYQLHYLTRRLWVWRDEYGNEAYWQEHLGRYVAKLGANECWPFIVDPEPLPHP